MNEKKKDILYEISKFIVNKRNLFFFIFILLGIASVFGTKLTQVEDDLVAYLSDDTSTVIALDLMDEEFTTFGTAKVMISNIDFDTALYLSEEIKQIEGVKSLEFEHDAEHYSQASALFNVTFVGEEDDDISIDAINEIRTFLENYDVSFKTTVGVNDADSLAEEMKVIVVIAVIIIVLVLAFTSKSFAEIPVLMLTFGTAALLNKGSDFIFGEISFVSNSVAIVLQLALGIDYAIILCHRFSEECEFHEAKEACIVALSKAIIEISSSSLTTISGLVALSFMHFGLGADLSRILIKSIIISLISVFILMPGLLVLFSKAINKTQHKNYVPSIKFLGKFSVKTRYFILPLFVIISIVSFFFSNQTEYLFSASQIRALNLTEAQIHEDRINEVFDLTNDIAIMIPSGDYTKESTLIAEIETYSEVETVIGLANTEAIDDYMLTDMLTARELSELLDLDYEMAALLYSSYAIDDENYAKLINNTDEYKLPLIDIVLFAEEMLDDGYFSLDEEAEIDFKEQATDINDGKLQLESDNYTRILVSLNLPEDNTQTFAFIDTLNEVCSKYYDEVYIAGNSTSNYDLSSTFTQDNLIVSILSALFVVFVLLFTFGSVAVPIMLIIVIQSAIFMNFAFPYIRDQGVFFIGYLVVSSIQMGANVDYAIVITNRFLDLRKTLDKKSAIIKALDDSFATVFTSGCILASAGIVIQNVTTNGTIATIGECIGRGTIISMVLVLVILPQILYIGADLITRTEFAVRLGREKTELRGKMTSNGHIKGHISGYIDAKVYGTITGEILAQVTNISQSEDTENET